MIDDIRRIQAEAANQIAGAASLDELATLERDLVGKGSELTGFKKQMGSLDHEARREVGAALNRAREVLADLGQSVILEPAEETAALLQAARELLQTYTEA